MARKTDWDTARLIAADKKHIWHPFTPMGEWCAPNHEPLVLVEGRGALLWDSEGREYIDGNSSIWTNIHGHNHPHINAAIREQLDLVAHTSFLGFTNPAAIELAELIIALFPRDSLSRIFYSDDGSTGMEAALRMTDQYWKLKSPSRNRVVSLRGGYHGDTAGAASLGASKMFGGSLSYFSTHLIQVTDVEQLTLLPVDITCNVQALIMEPLIQGAAGMRVWPAGTLAAAREWCARTGALLIFDEVMTGFGRTGKMFACEHEHVVPDIIVLGKALTGGYLPLAITAIQEHVFAPFRDAAGPRETLYYGHSYTGNALACAAAKASLEIFANDDVLGGLQGKIQILSEQLRRLRALGAVAEVRQCGFIAGIDLQPNSGAAANLPTGTVGAAVCRAARRHGLLTRPVRDVVVLMPPLCITEAQLTQAVSAIEAAILEVCEAAAAETATV